MDFDCADEINTSCGLELPKSLGGDWEVSVEQARSHLNGGFSTSSSISTRSVGYTTIPTVESIISSYSSF